MIQIIFRFFIGRTAVREDAISLKLTESQSLFEALCVELLDISAAIVRDV